MWVEIEPNWQFRIQYEKTLTIRESHLNNFNLNMKSGH